MYPHSVSLDNSNYHGNGVFASASFAPGDFIMQFSGIIRCEPTRYTIQIDEHQHLDMGKAIEVNINHSCSPNTTLVVENGIVRLHALRQMQKGEEITFNYLTTEYDMVHPFICKCGNSGCYKLISGFKNIPKSKQLDLLPFCSKFIRNCFSCEKGFSANVKNLVAPEEDFSAKL
jgi:hypothetical protein